MKLNKTGGLVLVLAVALLAMAVPAAQAAMVSQMNLGEMTLNAHLIARVTVLDVEQSSVELGGGELPVVEYTLRVEEAFKGSVDTAKETSVVVVRMLGDIKQHDAEGAIRKVSALPELPRLRMGHDYVLFTTAPSAIGLSAPVGLGQGSFSIYTDGKQEMAANELDNAGLFQGPVTYAELADAIRNELGQ